MNESPTLVAERRADPALLRELADWSWPVLSLYLPLVVSEDQDHHNALRYRGLIDQAWSSLDEGEIPDWSARLEAVETRRARLPDPLAGLAVFANAEHCTAIRLLRPVEAASTWAQAPCLRPLAWRAHEAGRYRVIALSVNRVRLLEGSSEGLELRPAPAVPESLEDALGREIEGGYLQYRGGAVSRGGPHYEGATHGSGDEERKVDLERFHRELAHALEPLLADDPLPTVLVADVSHGASFREKLDVADLLEESVRGNPDALGPRELHERAWPVFLRSRERDRELRHEELSRALAGRDAVRDLDELALAVVSGRVARLALASGAHRPGRVDPEMGTVQPARLPADDALDAIAALTLRLGGAIEVSEAEALPDGRDWVAELR